MKKCLYALLSAALITGCSLPKQEQPAPSDTPPPIYVPGEFNGESVYELLVAEMAGQQGKFDIAMANYLHQARLTGDPQIAERATRVAQYLRNVDAITQAATLWTQNDPENPEPYQISASVLLHQKRYEEALPLLERALEYDRPRMLAVIRSQIVEMPDPVVDGYLSLFGNMLADNPEQADLLITQGLLYKKRDEPALALKTLQKARDLAPDNLDALTQMAEVLRLQGDVKEALSMINQALPKYPDSQPLRILRTQLLFQTNDISAGVKSAQKVLKASPRDYQLRFYIALLMLEHDQTVPAKDLFTELLELNPNDNRPHFYLGAIAQQNKETEKAIEHFLQVDDPGTIYQAITRVSALLDAPEHRERVSRIISDQRKTRPELAAQLFTLEAEWLNLHDFSEDALILLEDAIKRYPEDISLIYTRAMMLERIDFSRAEQDLRRILEIDPDSSLALNALGYTLTVHTERYEEAYKLISKALSIRPDDAAIIDSMGWVLFKLGRIDESVTYLERAYKLIPDGEVAAHLIQAYWQQGQQDKARELLEESLEKDPENTHLQEAQAAISAR